MKSFKHFLKEKKKNPQFSDQIFEGSRLASHQS